MRAWVRRVCSGFLVAACVGLAAPLGVQLLERVSASVVQVRGTACRGGDRVGSGFVWPDRTRVVTALHVVERCAGLSVYYEDPGAQRSATIERTLASADLALLQVTDPPESAVAVLSETPIPANEDLVALGYRLNAPKMASTRLSVPFGSRRLEDLLPDSVRRSLASAGVPSLDLQILPLEGHLLPGHSGAPIFDFNGRVVAMGDGGLESGAVEIAWGVPSAHIRKLSSSTERLTQLGAPSAAHFSADLVSHDEEVLSCGQLRLTKVRTRTFRALVQTSDDAAGLQGFANLWGLGGMDLSDEEFDVYQDFRSGATVVVPAGMRVDEDEDSCKVEVVVPGHAEMIVTGRTTTDKKSASAAVKDMHQNLYGSTGLRWQPDPSFSYSSTLRRFDGLEVLRQSFVGYEVSLFAMQQRRMSFESLLMRKSAFVGVAAVTHEGAHLTADKVMVCALMESDGYCRSIMTHIKQYVLMMTATYLSTFALG